MTSLFDRFTSTRFSGDEVRLVYVSAESADPMDSVMQQLPGVLYGLLSTDPMSPGFSLTPQDSIIDTQASTTEAFRDLRGWVAGVSLVVGGSGIMNIMLVIVLELSQLSNLGGPLHSAGHIRFFLPECVLVGWYGFCKITTFGSKAFLLVQLCIDSWPALGLSDVLRIHVARSRHIIQS